MLAGRGLRITSKRESRKETLLGCKRARVPKPDFNPKEVVLANARPINAKGWCFRKIGQRATRFFPLALEAVSLVTPHQPRIAML